MRALIPQMVLSVALVAQGQPSLLADLNPLPPANPSSFPRAEARVGSGPFVLSVDHTATGNEPWVMTATGGSPMLLKDIRPGPLGSAPDQFTGMGNFVFFTADDGRNGPELWRTDGTTQGTQMVRDIRPGPVGSSPRDPVVFQGLLYFSADDGVSGRELWRSDGTAAGTTLFVQLQTGTGSGNPHEMAVVGSTLFFAADDAALGRELWRTNGSLGGTSIVRDISPGAGWSSPRELTAAGGLLFFTAETPTSGREVWRSDGTAVGTLQLGEIVAGSGSPFPSGLTAEGSRCFFTAATQAIGRELWVSDGATVTLVRDIHGGTPSSDPTGLTVRNGRVVFAATSAQSGRELWISDGTPAGTNLVADIQPGTGSSGPTELALVTGVGSRPSTIYFQADNGSSGRELWRTNGTAAGTTLVADLRPGSLSSSPSLIAQIEARLLSELFVFRANDGVHGTELFRSDGTATGTTVFDLDPGVSSSRPRDFVSVGGRGLFVADDGVHGEELWVTDGTPTGTTLLDLWPGPSGSHPASLQVWNGVLYFRATDATNGTELWRSDGSSVGTYLLRDIHPGMSSSAPRGFTAWNGALYFAAHDAAGEELWRTDGTSAGTQRVADIAPGNLSSQPALFLPLDNSLLFRAWTQANGHELWRTDGTAAGTVMVADIQSGAQGSMPDAFARLGSIAVFSADDGTRGRELWVSDGTAAGTALLVDLRPGTAAASPRELIAIRFSAGQERIAFVADDGVRGAELFVTDGTATGTQILKDIRLGSLGSDPRYLTRLPGGGTGGNDLLVFAADDGVHGLETWRSSGGTNDTVLMADVAAGPPSSISADGAFYFFLPGGNQVLFPADDGVRGLEPYRYDLSSQSLVLHQELRAGVFGSRPGFPVLVGSRLVFSADDGPHGVEPWTMAGMAAAFPFGSGCAGGSGLTPRLSAVGVPVLGNPGFGYRLTDAPAGSVGFLLFDFQRSGQAFGPCTLLVQPFIVHFVLANAGGMATFGLPISSSPSALGILIDTQGLVYDPPGAIFNLLSATNGVEALLGPN